MPWNVEKPLDVNAKYMCYLYKERQFFEFIYFQILLKVMLKIGKPKCEASLE